MTQIFYLRKKQREIKEIRFLNYQFVLWHLLLKVCTENRFFARGIKRRRRVGTQYYIITFRPPKRHDYIAHTTVVRNVPLSYLLAHTISGTIRLVYSVAYRVTVTYGYGIVFRMWVSTRFVRYQNVTRVKQKQCERPVISEC